MRVSHSFHEASRKQIWSGHIFKLIRSLNTLDSGPVHTYPYFFESAFLLLRIRKYSRQHEAYSNRICLSTRIRIRSSTKGSSLASLADEVNYRGVSAEVNKLCQYLLHKQQATRNLCSGLLVICLLGDIFISPLEKSLWSTAQFTLALPKRKKKFFLLIFILALAIFSIV